jgi:hypothetical protein
MTSLRRYLATAVAAGAVLATATAAAAQAAPIPFGSEQSPTRVAAWNGTAMWSHYDAATKTYSLVKSVDGGAPQIVNVPPRTGGPFDIDLGTNRSGSTSAVYTRAGDIFRLNVATGTETKFTGYSSPTLAERDPTIQRGAIAFIRRNRGFDELRVGGVPGQTQGSHLLVRRKSIAGAELGNRQIAYVEQTRGFGFGESDVHIRNLATHADRLVYKAKSGGANLANVTRPTYDDAPEGFVWARTNLGSGNGNRLVRYTLGGSKLSYAAGSPYYNSTAWAGDALGAIASGALDNTACQDNGTNYCAVALTGPLQFGLKP